MPTAVHLAGSESEVADLLQTLPDFPAEDTGTQYDACLMNEDLEMGVEAGMMHQGTGAGEATPCVTIDTDTDAAVSGKHGSDVAISDSDNDDGHLESGILAEIPAPARSQRALEWLQAGPPAAADRAPDSFSDPEVDNDMPSPSRQVAKPLNIAEALQASGRQAANKAETRGFASNLEEVKHITCWPGGWDKYLDCAGTIRVLCHGKGDLGIHH